MQWATSRIHCESTWNSLPKKLVICIALHYMWEVITLCGMGFHVEGKLSQSF